MDLLQPSIEAAIVEIDYIASNFGMHLISTGSNFILHEYEYAAMDARQWLKDKRFKCPLSITCWAEVAELTNEDAAKDIVSKADAYHFLISSIRASRLKAKSKIRKVVSEDAIETIISDLKNELKTIATNHCP